jgi:hypothetical protein
LSPSDWMASMRLDSSGSGTLGGAACRRIGNNVANAQKTANEFRWCLNPIPVCLAGERPDALEAFALSAT